MKIAANIAGGLLGLLFTAFSLMYLLNMMPDSPPPQEGTPMVMFMAAFAQTGYLTFVKVLELVGGILTAIPKTRNFGLLVLGPIIVNILAYHLFIMGGEGLYNPVILLICALALFLLYSGRRAFLGLLN